jgi:hypothetical protein
VIRAILFTVLLAGCRAEVDPPPATRAERDVANAWDRLLAQAVDDAEHVDYAMIQKKQGILDAYLGSMAHAAAPVNARRGLAYWLNAYQALAIHAVVTLQPSTSLLDYGHPIPRRGYAFFYARAYTIGEHSWSLAEILHEKLRLQFQDYRVHAAVNPGFRGGPRVQPGIYRGTSVERQLDEQFTAWIADDRTARIENDTAVFHAYFETFHDDFLGWSGTQNLCAFVARHAADGDRWSDLARRGCPHRIEPLDEALNRADGGARRVP